jgi:hypothetical protein
MSIRSKVLAGATVLSVIGGLGVAATGNANAVTPPCGNNCRAYFTEGRGPGAVLDVWKRAAKFGQKIILWSPSNHDPAEDFSYYRQGTVDEFFNLGLVPAGIDLQYGKDFAFELEYTPHGRPTGLCVGVGSKAADLSQVSLRNCGGADRAVWVEDSADANGPFMPLINGSDTNFSHPFVMTDHDGRVITYHMQRFSDTTVYDNQMWDNEVGVVGVSLPLG